MKNDSNKPLALGFMAILVLLFSLVFISLVQIQTSNKSMKELVDASYIKTAAANDMRDATRLVSGNLKTIMLSKDSPLATRNINATQAMAANTRRPGKILHGPARRNMSRKFLMGLIN